MFALFLLLFACGGGNKMSSGASGDAVSVFASPNMNNGNAVELDLVFVSTEDIVQAFDIIPSKNWFRNRAAFLASYVGQIEVLSYSFQPGEERIIQNFPQMKGRAAAVFIYADYPHSAQQPKRIRKIADLVIELGREDFYLSSEK